MKPAPSIDELYLDNFHSACNFARENGMRLVASAHNLSLINQNKIIRLELDHLHYVGDFVQQFDYFFKSVHPIIYSDFSVVDFSVGKYHDVIGYDKHPIFFPTIAEPILTTEQYLDFSKLSEGKTVLDLGAYSGLTSILFKDLVGPAGTVISVEADLINLDSIYKNLKLYNSITGNEIKTLYGAVWNHCKGLTFSTEGSMGSSATDIVGDNRGITTNVPSFTLSKIAELMNLTAIDFIKCDVEGAEEVIFEDSEFFKTFRPKIIVETHNNKHSMLTSEKVISDLTKYNYKHNIIEQFGANLPLIEFDPV